MPATLIIKYVITFPRKHIVKSKYRVMSTIIDAKTRGLVYFWCVLCCVHGSEYAHVIHYANHLLQNIKHILTLLMIIGRFRR